mmetsp:Transcript_50684/g.133585  ORF Transcript_50684/g.133585 Transcript_50684/m.133585 type:complete len:212 (-) Transcript_50684:309-944(-)
MWLRSPFTSFMRRTASCSSSRAAASFRPVETAEASAARSPWRACSTSSMSRSSASRRPARSSSRTLSILRRPAVAWDNSLRSCFWLRRSTASSDFNSTHSCRVSRSAGFRGFGDSDRSARICGLSARRTGRGPGGVRPLWDAPESSRFWLISAIWDLHTAASCSKRLQSSRRPASSLAKRRRRSCTSDLRRPASSSPLATGTATVATSVEE